MSRRNFYTQKLSQEEASSEENEVKKKSKEARKNEAAKSFKEATSCYFKAPKKVSSPLEHFKSPTKKTAPKYAPNTDLIFNEATSDRKDVISKVINYTAVNSSMNVSRVTYPINDNVQISMACSDLGSAKFEDNRRPYLIFKRKNENARIGPSFLQIMVPIEYFNVIKQGLSVIYEENQAIIDALAFKPNQRPQPSIEIYKGNDKISESPAPILNGSQKNEEKKKECGKRGEKRKREAEEEEDTDEEEIPSSQEEEEDLFEDGQKMLKRTKKMKTVSISDDEDENCMQLNQATREEEIDSEEEEYKQQLKRILKKKRAGFSPKVINK